MILGGDTVTRMRGKTRDRYGNLAGADASADISGCSVQPAGGTEQTGTGEMVVTNMTLFAPAGTDILVTDRIGWAGDTYAVDGPPKAWPESTGLPHLEVQLKLVQGQG